MRRRFIGLLLAMLLLYVGMTYVTDQQVDKSFQEGFEYFKKGVSQRLNRVQMVVPKLPSSCVHANDLMLFQLWSTFLGKL